MFRELGSGPAAGEFEGEGKTTGACGSKQQHGKKKRKKKEEEEEEEEKEEDRGEGRKCMGLKADAWLPSGLLACGKIVRAIELFCGPARKTC